MRSYKVLAEGGLPMQDDVKEKSRGIVRVKTDDTEISLCHLLTISDRTIRVGVTCPTRADLETQETGRKVRTQILEIQRHRIRSMTRCN